MKDIQVIRTGFQSGSFDLLRNAGERFQACHYFCAQIHAHTTKMDDKKARWYFFAASSGFRSVIDMVNGDVKKLIGQNKWHESKQQKAMLKDPLVKILWEVRNVSVHSDRIQGEPRNYTVTVIGENGEQLKDMRSLFFDKLDKKGNFEKASGVSSTEIEWFNRQSEIWPVDLLIMQGLHKVSEYVHWFCAEHFPANAQNATEKM